MVEERKESSEEEKCPDCGGRLIYKDNETYCNECGLVVDDCPVDFTDGDIHKSNNEGQRISRTGKPMNYIDGYGGNKRLPPTVI